MSNPIYRLIYISKNRLEGDEEQIHNEIQDILSFARKANATVGITGALMFNNGCFAQVLEGAQGPVEQTFERIQCDMRHEAVVVLSYEEVDSRAFNMWSMAYVGHNSNALEEFANIKSESGFDANSIPTDRIFEILKEHLIDAENGNAAAA